MTSVNVPTIHNRMSGSRPLNKAVPSGRNFKLEIEYDGTNYCGWQVQTRNLRTKSIQDVIEKALQKILHKKIHIYVSGRTDAGVHAVAQVANFHSDSDILPEKLKKALNALLPDALSISSVREVAPDFHSRFSAKSKTYRFFLLNRRHNSPFLNNKVYFYPYTLNLSLMRKQAKLLEGKHDFTSFCAVNTSVKDKVRTVKRVTIKKAGLPMLFGGLSSREKPLIVIEIEAEGFLYNMVRNIVGSLIDVGRGKPIDLAKVLESRDRCKAGMKVPAHGLYLTGVKY